MIKTARRFFWTFLISSLAGTGLHFLYSSTKFFPLAFLSPLNESVWEHVKIVLIPMLFGLYFLWKQNELDLKHFLPAASLGILTATFLTLSVHYLLSCGLSIDGLAPDIILYYAAMAIGFFIAFRLRNFDFSALGSLVLVGGLALLILAVIVFTISPPDLPMFLSQSV